MSKYMKLLLPRYVNCKKRESKHRRKEIQAHFQLVKQRQHKMNKTSLMLQVRHNERKGDERPQGSSHIKGRG